MSSPQDTQRPARLYRSRGDRVIAGIAGGVARYLAVDPVLVRLAFVALVLAGGAGILAYIIGWIVIPEEPWEEGADAARPAPQSRPGAETPRSGGPGARIVVGAVLIGIGGLLLLEWAIPSLGDVFWPLLLIAGGTGLLVYGARR
jgi:phage shock protein C